jgi:hypothetical protein
MSFQFESHDNEFPKLRLGKPDLMNGTNAEKIDSYLGEVEFPQRMRGYGRANSPGTLPGE